MAMFSHNLAQKSSTRCPQDAPRRSQDGHKTGQEGPQDTCKTPPRRPKTSSRRLQDGPRCAQDAPKTPYESPRTPQDAYKTPQDASRPRFWCLGTSILEGFWRMSNTFRDKSRLIFGDQNSQRILKLHTLFVRFFCPTCILTFEPDYRKHCNHT